jgi:hypothetical protein
MKIKLLYAILPLIVFFTSCNEDIDLVGEFKETAVVYGLLDQHDSVHMIKINRAFIGPGNALEIAQIADSNYFQQVDAVVEEYVNDVFTGRSWMLRDTMITDKKEGVFFGPEQKVYVFYSKSLDNSSNPTGSELLGNATYRLRADINGGLFEIQGETELVTGIYTGTDASTYSFKFAKDATEYRTTTISANTGNSYIINTTVDIHYSEFIGTAETPRTFSWRLGEMECEPNQTKQFAANGQTFYEQLAQHCQSVGNPLTDKRNFTGLTVRVVGGAQDFYNYILVNQPSSSLAQNKPTFTNLTATNEHPVIGIFSSRFTHEVYHEFTTPSSQFLRCLDEASTEVLCIGSVTGPYLFCSQHPQDLLPSPESWACN